MRALLAVVAFVVASAAAGEERHVPGEFATVQAAIDAASPGDTIRIAPGVYPEQVLVRTPRLKLIGTGEPEDTVIQTDMNYFGLDADGKRWKWRSLALYAGFDIELQSLTIENILDAPTLQAMGVAARAKAARFNGRVLATDVRFIGWVDTLQIKGFGYFERVEFHGSNDFVYGQGSATFRDCLFYSRGGGTVFGQGSEGDTQFVVVDSRFEAAAGTRVFLARPWKPYSTVIIRNSYIGPGVHRLGYRNPWDEDRAETLYFEECDNYGPGSDTSERVPWARVCPE